jgi:hypothetical protein
MICICFVSVAAENLVKLCTVHSRVIILTQLQYLCGGSVVKSTDLHQITLQQFLVRYRQK